MEKHLINRSPGKATVSFLVLAALAATGLYLSDALLPLPPATVQPVALPESEPAGFMRPFFLPDRQLPAGLTPEQAEFLHLINVARRDAGVAPLAAEPGVLAVAQQKADDMVADGYFSHHSPTLGSPFDMLRRAGIPFRAAAENIAANQDVAAAHTALMASPGHRRNILDPRYQVIGIGVAAGGPTGGGIVVAQVFVGN